MIDCVMVCLFASATYSPSSKTQSGFSGGRHWNCK